MTNYLFGFPKQFNPKVFPTESDMVSHSHFLKGEKISSGEWKQNTPISDVARVVADDVREVWAKTDIPCHGIQNPGS